MPETFAPGVIYSIRAAADLPKARFVGFDGNLCASGAKALGVTQYDFAAGEMAGVIVNGIALVEAGGAISQGAEVASGADGKAVALTDASTQKRNGWALDAASAAGQVIRVLLAA